jgi:hypothetical protein
VVARERVVAGSQHKQARRGFLPMIREASAPADRIAPAPFRMTGNLADDSNATALDAIFAALWQSKVDNHWQVDVDVSRSHVAR